MGRPASRRRGASRRGAMSRRGWTSRLTPPRPAGSP
jgi:hypothetical protein